MKNIHLIPTDKPSRLYSKDGNHILDTTMAIDWYISSACYKPQNIYITSSNDIGVGDYYLPRVNSIYKCIEDATGLNLERRLGVGKIVLTTDPELINDGVQGIDDEFLNWFINNPGCEYVKVEVTEISCIIPNFGDVDKYRIVIPKEEPKQKSLVEKMIPLQLKYNLDMMKQETLEQAAEKYAKQFDYAEDSSPNIDFIEGAKWQQEQENTANDILNYILTNDDGVGIALGYNSREMIEQHFKNIGYDR